MRCERLGRHLSAKGVIGRDSDAAIDFGRHFARMGLEYVRIPPEDVACVQNSPDDGAHYTKAPIRFLTRSISFEVVSYERRATVSTA